MGAQVSGAGGCAQIRPELGVYVLGAITPAGRAVDGRHVTSGAGLAAVLPVRHGRRPRPSRSARLRHLNHCRGLPSYDNPGWP
jgi:hypothetical protein